MPSPCKYIGLGTSNKKVNNMICEKAANTDNIKELSRVMRKNCLQVRKEREIVVKVNFD